MAMSKGYVCRWGGEEFLIVLEDCEQERANSSRCFGCAARTVDRMSRTGYLRDDEPVGVVQVASDEKIDDILRRADKKLYNAKAGGRDRIL